MPAYKKELNRGKCPYCRGRTVTHSVYNTHNSHCGDMCSRCADRRVRELNAEEKNAFNSVTRSAK